MVRDIVTSLFVALIIYFAILVVDIGLLARFSFLKLMFACLVIDICYLPFSFVVSLFQRLGAFRKVSNPTTSSPTFISSATIAKGLIGSIIATILLLTLFGRTGLLLLPLIALTLMVRATVFNTTITIFLLRLLIEVI